MKPSLHFVRGGFSLPVFMGVRGRLIAVTTLVLGLTVLASLLLSLRLEDWEERRAHSERSEQIVGALASAIAVDVKEAGEGAGAIVAAVERDRDAFGLRAVYVLDKDGVDLAHADSPRLDGFLKTLIGGDDDALVDPPAPAWPRRIAHPIFVGGKRYVVVGVVDEEPVNVRLIERNRRLGATNLVISLVGLLVLLMVLSSEVLRPLRQLASMAEALGRGSTRLNAKVNGGRELQQVGEALNDAAVRLGAQRDSLELEVARRTRDLAAANSELSAMNERLQQMALTDPLTGLFNRRALEQALVHEVTRQKRGKRPFSLMMIDVDHFKKLNDTHGHAAGDDVLRVLARLVPAALRASDVVALVGGEEFVVLLLDTELPHALTAAEKVRESIRSHTFAGGNTQPLGRVTISIGLACWPQHGENAEAVLAAADKALYAAKAAGRDRVLAAPDPTTTTTKEPQQEL